MALNTTPLKPLDNRWPNDTVGKKSDKQRDVPVKALNDFVKVVYEEMRIDGEDEKVIADFAATNGFSHNPALQFVNSKPYQRMPAWVGPWGGIITHEIFGSLADYPVQMGVYYQVTGSTQSRGNDYSYGILRYGIVRVQLNKLFPQLVLDSNVNDRGKILSSVSVTFKNNQRLKLEGDFDEYFDFYAPKDLYLEALTVLAPNFMQTLKDSSVDFDVEFYGKEMVLISRSPLFTETTIRVVEKALGEQLAYMKRLEQSWSYSPRQQPLDLLKQASISGPALKIGRLRYPLYGVVITIFFTLVAAALLYGRFFD
jgi:hypothetical protein